MKNSLGSSKSPSTPGTITGGHATVAANAEAIAITKDHLAVAGIVYVAATT